MGALRATRAALLAALLVATLVSPTPGPAAASSTITTSWDVRELTLADGRTFFARVPACAPAGDPACAEFLSRPRLTLIFLHGAGAAEDLDKATRTLIYLDRLQRNSLLVYAVSAGGTKRWDAGICCTFSPVSDVGYLVRVVDRLDNAFAVDRARVGLMGSSNGGMLSLDAACERPDVFKAATSWAGPWVGTCDDPSVRVAQWHGASDTVVPVNGGARTMWGQSITWPPATDLAMHMASGRTFPLTVLAGIGHPMPAYVHVWQIKWLNAQFGS